MKIAVITSGFLPVPATKGGAVENLIVNLLNENEKHKNFNSHVYSVYEEKAINESKKYEEAEFEFIKPNIFVKILDKITFWIAKNILKKENCQSYRYIFQRLYFLNKISKDLKKNNYDKVLLENHPTQYLALKWRKNYLKYKDRYYYHCHNEFKDTYKCKEIIENTNKIICVSQYIANTMATYLNMDKNKFVVLKNGIDSKRFNLNINDVEKNKLKEKYNIGKEDKILLFVGRVVPEKGVKELINSLEYIKTENVKILVLGAALNALKIKTNYQLEIEELSEKFKGKVMFTGFVNYGDIYKFYKLADIAVFPSIWDDPAPLTIIEALTSGLPIITTNSGGIPEYATNGSAIILERDEKLVENLAKAIDNLLNNEEKLKEMEQKCILVSKELNTEKFYKGFCNMMG